MLHVWLIPILFALLTAVFIFYLVLARGGGSGKRTEGRKLVDKPMHEDDLPPG